jgi:hypothetical protein
MSNQYLSAIYILGMPDHVPPGKLVHIEDHPGALAAIYINRLEMRSPAVWDFNWLTRHQIGHALWQQNWTSESRDGRMQEPAQGLGVAVSRWEIVPAHKLPRGVYVFPIEHKGRCIWYIRAGYCTQALCDAMNAMLERIAGDALWVQRWYEYQDRFAGGGPTAPALLSPQAPLPV